jgi:hypothetical protein
VSVSEVFKVTAQVDHDLTKVSKFDRRLGLIKNMGRHKNLTYVRCATFWKLFMMQQGKGLKFAYVWEYYICYIVACSLMIVYLP